MILVAAFCRKTISETLFDQKRQKRSRTFVTNEMRKIGPWTVSIVGFLVRKNPHVADGHLILDWNDFE